MPGRCAGEVRWSVIMVGGRGALLLPTPLCKPPGSTRLHSHISRTCTAPPTSDSAPAQIRHLTSLSFSHLLTRVLRLFAVVSVSNPFDSAAAPSSSSSCTKRRFPRSAALVFPRTIPPVRGCGVAHKSSGCLPNHLKQAYHADADGHNIAG